MYQIKSLSAVFVLRQHLIDINESHVFLTIAQFFTQLRFQILDSLNIVRYSYFFITLLGLVKFSTEFMVKGLLVLDKVYIPAIEIRQIEVIDVINLQ